ncbi:MAG: hypothetical protein K2N94_02080 [Lachnospiraceae bacterium]|nr:hypothetical protein [Lachnospiraceae bacterium]
MNKSTDSQKLLLGVLVLVLIMFSAYWFGYRNLAEQTEIVEAENEQLSREIVLLERKVKNQELYETQTVSNRELVSGLLEIFGPGVTPEKSILFFIEMGEQYGMEISSITFNETQPFYQAVWLNGEEGLPLSAYANTFNISYSTTYEGLKGCIEYINQYPERMSLQSMTTAYHAEDGLLTGTLSVIWYSLTGTDKVYSAPEFENVPYGNENIFRSGN